MLEIASVDNFQGRATWRLQHEMCPRMWSSFGGLWRLKPNVGFDSMKSVDILSN